MFSVNHKLKIEIARKINSEIPYWKEQYEIYIEAERDNSVRQRLIPSHGFLKLFRPDNALAKVIGPEPLTVHQAHEKLFAYIRENNLLDKEERTIVNTDPVLAAVCDGESAVSIFALTSFVRKHLIEE